MSVMSQVRATARTEGASAALRLLQKTVDADAIVCGPKGHALVPDDLLESVSFCWVNGSRVEREAADEFPLGGYGSLSAVKFTVDASAARSREAAELVSGWEIGLAWLRMGLSEYLLDRTLAYLGGRTVGGESLLLQQLVRGSVADARGMQLQASAALAERMSQAACVDAHALITDADRELLRLLGASGFQADGPGTVAHISALLADLHISPEIQEECGP